VVVDTGLGAVPSLRLPGLMRRESTAEAVASVLREQIAAGAIGPGTQLREEEIARALDVSRNTVRETFRLLQYERLVEHALHRGVFVRIVGAEEVRAIYRTRQLVEPLGLEAAVEDPEVVDDLERIVAGARRDAGAGRWDLVGTADIAFHRRLVGACESVHLRAMFEGVLAELRLAFLRLTDSRGLHEPYLQRNADIVGLLRAGDLAAARREMHAYLASAEQQVLAVVVAA
jgi:DNA-binding GntR family transcriptional regulator